MQKRTRRPHGLKTRKVSISVGADDLAVLLTHAKKRHGGNVSAVIHELVANLRRLDAMDRVLKRLGGDRVTEQEMNALREEIAAAHVPRSRKSAA